MTISALASLMSALPMPILLIDSTERIAAANPPALRLLGGAQVGRHYINALRQPAVLDAVETCLRHGQGGQARYLGREGGRDTTWSVSAGPVDLPQGRGVALSFEDVTAVEEAGEMRRDFVANVSHELRTPVTALAGFIETLRGAARDDPKARERFLSIMEREAARMSQLVSDLLSLSRVEQEERLRPTGKVDLSNLTLQVAALLEPVAARDQVRIETRLPGAPAWCRATRSSCARCCRTSSQTPSNTAAPIARWWWSWACPVRSLSCAGRASASLSRIRARASPRITCRA